MYQVQKDVMSKLKAELKLAKYDRDNLYSKLFNKE